MYMNVDFDFHFINNNAPVFKNSFFLNSLLNFTIKIYINKRTNIFYLKTAFFKETKIF